MQSKSLGECHNGTNDPVAVSDTFVGFEKPSSSVDRGHSLRSLDPATGGAPIAPPPSACSADTSLTEGGKESVHNSQTNGFLYEIPIPGDTCSIFIFLEGICKGKWKFAV